MPTTEIGSESPEGKRQMTPLDKRRHWLALAWLMPVTVCAQADTSQTLYGVMDAAVRYTTTSDTSRSGTTALVNGPRTSSRLGFRGRETIDSDLQAIYMLEASVDPAKGSFGGASATFNRFGFVGIRSRSLGEVTMGVQNSAIHEVLAFHGFDALEVGNNPDWTSYVGTQYAPKYDRSLRYAQQLGALQVSAIAVIDDTRPLKDRPAGGTAVYKGKDWQFGGAYMKEEAGSPANHGRRETTVVGGGFKTGPVQWSGFFLNHENPAFLRKDKTYVAGFAYDFAPNLLLLGRVLATRTTLGPASGFRRVAIVTAEYALSKRTQPYVGIDYTTFSGVAVPRSNENQRIGVTVGLRHRF